jgi:hypothetical protein
MDTSGFYKFDHDGNELLYAPNAVYAPTFTLLKEIHAEYEYPQDGWYWFDSEEECRSFFSIE